MNLRERRGGAVAYGVILTRVHVIGLVMCASSLPAASNSRKSLTMLSVSVTRSWRMVTRVTSLVVGLPRAL